MIIHSRKIKFPGEEIFQDDYSFQERIIHPGKNISSRKRKHPGENIIVALNQ